MLPNWPFKQVGKQLQGRTGPSAERGSDQHAARNYRLYVCSMVSPTISVAATMMPQHNQTITPTVYYQATPAIMNRSITARSCATPWQSSLFVAFLVMVMMCSSTCAAFQASTRISVASIERISCKGINLRQHSEKTSNLKMSSGDQDFWTQQKSWRNKWSRRMKLRRKKN